MKDMFLSISLKQIKITGMKKILLLIVSVMLAIGSFAQKQRYYCEIKEFLLCRHVSEIFGSK